MYSTWKRFFTKFIRVQSCGTRGAIWRQILGALDFFCSVNFLKVRANFFLLRSSGIDPTRLSFRSLPMSGNSFLAAVRTSLVWHLFYRFRFRCVIFRSSYRRVRMNILNIYHVHEYLLVRSFCNILYFSFSLQPWHNVERVWTARINLTVDIAYITSVFKIKSTKLPLRRMSIKFSISVL